MKKCLLSIASGALCIATCLAQEDSVVVYNNIVSKSVYTDNGVTSHKWNLNFLSISPATDSTATAKDGWHANWDVGPSLIYVGFTELGGNDVRLNPASSWEWGFDLMRLKSWNRSKTFGYEFGLLLTRSSYRLSDNNAFHLDADGNTLLDDALQGHVGKNADKDYRHQRLFYWSWRVPFVFNYQPTKIWGFSLGAEAELRHHIRSRARVGNDKKYYLERHNLDVNPFSCNVLASVRIDRDFAITARYNLTDFFGNKSRLDVQPFMVGFCVDL